MGTKGLSTGRGNEVYVKIQNHNKRFCHQPISSFGIADHNTRLLPSYWLDLGLAVTSDLKQRLSDSSLFQSAALHPTFANRNGI